MSDRTKDELRKRFNESQGDDDGTTTGVSDSSGPSDSSHTGESGESGETDEKGGSGLKERKQVAMYLPADLREDLAEFYDELDARSKLAGEGELEKNREFYTSLVEFALDRREEFAESLGIEIDANE